MKREGLIVSSSNVPVIRAGYSNIILLLLLVMLVLINQVLNDFGMALFPRGLILLGLCLVILKVYTHSVSRIFINDGKTLVLVGPFSESKINAGEIVETKVYGIPSSMTIFLKIKRKASTLPVFYFFVAASTSYGTYANTKTKLLSLLGELN
ncbi:MAG: hypothetical protein ABIF87_10610 [Pseudomonadota bacterium]